MTYIERIVELDGTVTEKPYSKEQLAATEKIRIEDELLDQAEAAKASEKAALLAKLGITEEEAQLLLGGN
jgi:hypothetical protein